LIGILWIRIGVFSLFSNYALFNVEDNKMNVKISILNNYAYYLVLV